MFIFIIQYGWSIYNKRVCTKIYLIKQKIYGKALVKYF